jgi:hypothetical protein
MDKNKDNTFDVPAAEIQDKITLLMGLPPEEAAARLDKHAPPRRIGKRVVRTTVAIPEPQVEEAIIAPASTEPIAPAAPVQPEPLVSNETADDRAVDDIVKHESEELLTDKDKQIAEFAIPPRKPKGIKRFLTAWWNNKILRNITAALILIAISVIIFMPTTRYAVLNSVGVRAGMQFQVVDQVSGRPIKNVEVSAAGIQTKSDDEGNVKLTGLKLGDTEVQLKKRSFKAVTIPITVGWGSNPFNAPMELEPTGATFVFTTKDWLSGLPLHNVEVSDGESVGLSDENGIAKLTIEPTDSDVTISISYNNYRTETVTIPADSTKGGTVTLVPSKQDVFISKRQGKYDVYSRYVDGTQETVLLPGTGNEQADTHLLSHPTDPIHMFVSSREGERNDQGYMMSNMYILNSDTKQVEKITSTSSERIRLVGWIGDAVVLVKTISGPSGYTTNRQQIVTYDVSDKKLTDITGANYFSDVRVINDSIYYVLPSSDGSQSKGLTKSSADGKQKTILLAKNIWVIYRADAEKLFISTEGDEWYSITLSDGKVEKLEGAPALPQNKVFVANPTTKQIAWLEERDGKSTLLVNEKDGKQKEVVKQPGMSYPLRWLNDTTILYTIANSQETANYIVSTNNSTVKKVGDVTVSVYSDNQYYY